MDLEVPREPTNRRMAQYEECEGRTRETARPALMGETEDCREMKCLLALKCQESESEKQTEIMYLPLS